MWDRAILKANAKTALRGRYWKTFLTVFVVLLITDAFSVVTMPFSVEYAMLSQEPARNLEKILALSGINSMISLISVLYGIFVGFALVIGLARFFVHNHFGETDLRTVFSGFKRDYMNGVGAMFVTRLFIGLWTLLFIIPGIVKGVQYSLVPFILSDNPALPGSRARELSRILTNGEKGGIFVLWLSFLGWYLLGCLALGVGVLFVTPYFKATMAELYLFLRDRAVQSGMVHPAEFGLVPPPPPPAPFNSPMAL